MIKLQWILLIMSLLLMLISAYLCYKNIENWGWFLFIGFILTLVGAIDINPNLNKKQNHKNDKN